MSDKKSNLGFILFFFVLFVSLLAWITYGNIDSVFGMLMYLIIGICAIFIWIIPIVGFVIGIIFSGYLYVSTLNIAQITPALLPFIWFCFNSFIGISYNVVFTILLIQRFKFRFPKNIKNIALINCNIIDGLRNSDIIEGGVILIENKLKEGKEGKNSGLIKAVGTANDIEIPEGYEKIDLDGQWVLPGLINSHCHLMGSGKPMKAMKMTSLPDETLHKLFKILNIPLIRMLLLYMMHGSTLTALNSGVTTLRSLGEVPFLDVKLRKKIEKRKVIGPRLLVAGIAIAPTGGHGGFSGIVADSSAEIRKIVRKNLRNDVDCLKIMSTGGVMDAKKLDEAGKPQMTVEEIETACIEAHRGGILVGSHVESTQGVKEALLGGVDTIEHGAEMTDEIVELYKNNPKSLRGYSALSTTIASGMGMGTLPPEVTQISAMSYANTKGVSRGEIKSLQRAYKEGLKIIAGTDASVPYAPHYEMWKELEYYLHYVPEMVPQEAIYFATKSAAEVLGIDDITGSIEVGKSADLQVVAKNPLEDIKNLAEVTKVIIRGYLIHNPSYKRIKKLDETPIMEYLELNE